jgi:hypothetical protein
MLCFGSLDRPLSLVLGSELVGVNRWVEEGEGRWARSVIWSAVGGLGAPDLIASRASKERWTPERFTCVFKDVVKSPCSGFVPMP